MKLIRFFRKNIWPFLAGLGSALVMILAFFIPSLQDQYDRYLSRSVISRYEHLGNEFFSEEKYDMAEQAYQKAFELSESRRLDLEIKRLKAKINRIYMNPRWGAPPPEDLQAIDFQYVLHFQRDEEPLKERVATLNSYGIFLVATHKTREAEETFGEAIRIDSTDATSYVNLGNLYDQRGLKEKAEMNYLKALQLDSMNARAAYNLGLFYAERGDSSRARMRLEKAHQIDPDDSDISRQLRLLQP